MGLLDALSGLVRATLEVRRRQHRARTGRLTWQRLRRRRGADHSGARGRTRLGWTLLALGVLLFCWRFRLDYLHGHAMAVRPLPTAVATLPPATPAPQRQAVAATGTATSDPSGQLVIAGGPSLDAGLVNGILAAYSSPLRDKGLAIVALSRRYRVDDAVALAFFVMESRAGTEGEALITHSFGNLRPMPGQPMVDGYRAYDTWLEGAAEWFQVMRTFYLDTLHLGTVEVAIPIYAPPSDTNDPDTLIAGMRQLVACWHGALAVCPADPASVPALLRAPAMPSRAPTGVPAPMRGEPPPALPRHRAS